MEGGDKQKDKHALMRRLEDKLLSVFLGIVIMLNSWALAQIIQIESEISQLNTEVLVLMHKAGLQ